MNKREAMFALIVFALLFFVFGQFNTKYYYVVGIGHTERTFWFITPPEVGPDVPYTFGLIGKRHSESEVSCTIGFVIHMHM